MRLLDGKCCSTGAAGASLAGNPCTSASLTVWLCDLRQPDFVVMRPPLVYCAVMRPPRVWLCGYATSASLTVWFCAGCATMGSQHIGIFSRT